MRVIKKEGQPLDRTIGGGRIGPEMRPLDVQGSLRARRKRETDRCLGVCASIAVSLMTSLGCLPPPPLALSPQALALCSNQGGGLERSVWANWK